MKNNDAKVVEELFNVDSLGDRTFKKSLSVFEGPEGQMTTLNCKL